MHQAAGFFVPPEGNLGSLAIFVSLEDDIACDTAHVLSKPHTWIDWWNWKGNRIEWDFPEAQKLPTAIRALPNSRTPVCRAR